MVAPGRSLASGGYSPDALPTAISQPAGARPSGSWRKGAACPLALRQGGARRGGRRKSRSGARAPQRPAEAEPGAAARARKRRACRGGWSRARGGEAPAAESRASKARPTALLPPLGRDVSRGGGAERAPGAREGCCGRAAQANGAPPARHRVSSRAAESLLPGWVAALSRVFSRSAPGWFQRSAEPAQTSTCAGFPA